MERGTVDGVRAMVLGASDAERRACAKPLAAFERELTRSQWWERPGYQELFLRLNAALLGCVTEGRRAERVLRSWMTTSVGPVAAPIILARRPAWLDAVYDRLAADLGEWNQLYPLFEELRIGLGRDRPRTDAYLRAYLHQHGEATVRDDAEFLALLPDILRVEGIGQFLYEPWPAIVAGLVGEGHVDRTIVMRIAHQALLRGGSPGQLRPHVKILQALAPTLDEIARDAPDLVRLVSGTPSFVASYALDGLRTLDKQSPLEFATVRELTAAVFARSEKGLATKQLTWIAARAKDPDRVDDVCTSVAEALAHERPDVQEQALKLLERLWPTATPATRDAIAFALDGVAPRLREQARRLVGDAAVPTIDPGGDDLIVASPAVDAVHPVADLDELVQATSRLIETKDGIEAERVFDGLLRLAGTPADELREAFAPLLPRLTMPDQSVLGSWMRGMSIVDLTGDIGVVALVIHRLIGDPIAPGSDVFTVLHPVGVRAPSPTALRLERLQEIALIASTGAVRGLLALPTRASGHVDPDVLVERIAVRESAGERIWPEDLTQAILRLPREEVTPASAAVLGALVGKDGRRLAAHVAADHADPISSRRVVAEGRVRRPGIHPQLAGVGGAEDAYGFALTPENREGGWWEVEWMRHWPITLPSHREVVAAHALRFLGEAWGAEALAVEVVLRLGNMHGPVGSAVCDLVLLMASAHKAEQRPAAADALIGMIATGAIDAALFAAELAALGEAGMVMPSRVAPVLGDVAQVSRRHAEWVWAALREALPSFLARKAKDTHLLLGLAADIATTLGVHDEVDGLAAIAGAKATSRLVAEARRLRDALGA